MESDGNSYQRLVFKSYANQQERPSVISEHEFCSDFDSFWKDLLPLLTPSFVRVFNEAYPEDICDQEGNPVGVIPLTADVERPDYLAELAFQLARATYEGKTTTTVAFRSAELRKKVVDSMVQFSTNYYPEDGNANVTADDVWERAAEIAFRYECLLRANSEFQAQFSPAIRGSGFLPSCYADLAIGATLVEVKTVTRNVSGKDLRQVITYLALQAATGEYRWSSAAIFNPRRGVFYRFGVDALLYRVSGGQSSPEVFQRVAEFLATRDTEIDGRF